MKKVLVLGVKSRELIELCNLLKRESYSVVTADSSTHLNNLVKNGNFKAIFCDHPLFYDFKQLSVKSILLKLVASGVKVFVLGSGDNEDNKESNTGIVYVDLPISSLKLRRLMAVEERDTKGLRGFVDNFEIIDYLQLLAINKRTKAMVVDGKQGRGVLVMAHGELIYAAYGDLKGEFAFHAITNMQDGKITDRKLKKIPPANIMKPLEKLLLECSLKEDEGKNPQSDVSEDDFLHLDEFVGTAELNAFNRPVSKRKNYLLYTGLLGIILCCVGTGILLFNPGVIMDRIGGKKMVSEASITGINVQSVEVKPKIQKETIMPQLVDTKNNESETEDDESLSVAEDENMDILFRLHGSNTIGSKLAPKLAERYLLEELNGKNIEVVQGKEDVEKYITGEIETNTGKKRVAIEIFAHGSSTGFRDLDAGLCDIGMASRKIKDKEVKKLARFGDMLSPEAEHVLALDGIAVLVNKSNPIESISINELADIFAGKVTDWSEVGDGRKKGKINVYARDGNSGTYDTFKSIVLKKVPLISDARRFESNPRLSDSVAEDENGIGFTGLPYVRQSKSLLISDDGTVPIAANFFTVATEDYPLARRLYFYLPLTNRNLEANKFVDFALNASGQSIVDEVGFIDLMPRIFNYNVDIEDYDVHDKGVVDNYIVNIKGKKRLSVNFRFLQGTYKLDTRSIRDVDRIAKFLESRDFKEIVLFGFTDSSGDYYKNMGLSLRRAKIVRNELKSRGIFVNKVIGMSEELPVASNNSDKGREKNRRVSVWVAE